jgi:hypothetical protein
MSYCRNNSRFMVFNAIFSNISVISWRSILLVEETGGPGENSELSQVTDKLYHIMLYRTGPRNNSTILSYNRRKRQHRYPWHTNTWPLPFLALYRHLKKMGEIKLVLWTQTSSLSENRRSHFLQVSKMATLMHNKTNRVALKNVLILNIIHDILNFRSTEIVICIILDLIKRVNGLSHHLNIK